MSALSTGETDNYLRETVSTLRQNVLTSAHPLSPSFSLNLSSICRSLSLARSCVPADLSPSRISSSRARSWRIWATAGYCGETEKGWRRKGKRDWARGALSDENRGGSCEALAAREKERRSSAREFGCSSRLIVSFTAPRDRCGSPVVSLLVPRNRLCRYFAILLQLSFLFFSHYIWLGKRSWKFQWFRSRSFFK